MTSITISGLPGTGTSTIARLLSEKTQISYIYIGELFRKLASQSNMTLAEFGTYAEKHAEIDRTLDEQQLTLLKKGDCILEGRIAGWIAHRNHIPAIKIMLIADENTRAQRLVKREGGELKKRKQEMYQREKSENRRYKKYYHIDTNDLSIYDVIIDTSKLTPEEITDQILNYLQSMGITDNTFEM